MRPSACNEIKAYFNESFIKSPVYFIDTGCGWAAKFFELGRRSPSRSFHVVASVCLRSLAPNRNSRSQMDQPTPPVRRTPTRTVGRRGAFTLVELLVVIGIIAL